MLILIAHPYTSEAGTRYAAGATADLPPEEGQLVIAAGLGTSADGSTGTVTPAAPSGSAVIATLTGEGALDVVTDAPSPWGLTTAGVPYYDPVGPAAGEGAALLVDTLELAHF